MIGAESITGPTISQACATGARTVAQAAAEVDASGEHTVLAVTTDRCSNGAHVYYPNPQGPGGMGDKEDIVMDSFGHDPWARNSMIQTAENVAAESGITRERQDECTLVRYQQYQQALAADGAFQKRYMLLPFEVKDASGRKTVATLATDEGIFTTRKGLAALKPAMPEGAPLGSQTSADGSQAHRSRATARAMSKTPGRIQLCAYGRAEPEGLMAVATVPAAKAALEAAGVGPKDVGDQTHNPFVNDLYSQSTRSENRRLQQLLVARLRHPKAPRACAPSSADRGTPNPGRRPPFRRPAAGTPPDIVVKVK
jgi:acetyl-CoA acetyltransferase